MTIAIIGRGLFGSAISSVLTNNKQVHELYDQGDVVTKSYDVVFIAVGAQLLRGALHEKRIAFSDQTIVVSCTKGIERNTRKLPFEIYGEVITVGKYHTLSGPSFATEIQTQVPTVVDVAGLQSISDISKIKELLNCDYFKIETHDSVHEIELAGALKNVYAIAAGFLAGSGGKNNTHAHLQVVALREYQEFIAAFGKTQNVVCPSIVGDLYLTCGSTSSRNYRLGYLRASGKDIEEGVTVEGAETVWPLLELAKEKGVSLPLAESVARIVSRDISAKEALFTALGF